MQRALELTEPLLDPRETRSAASQIRALTLRGAEAVLAEAEAEVGTGAGAGSRLRLQAHLTERHDATISRGDLAELDPPPGDPDGATPASDALRWARGE